MIVAEEEESMLMDPLEITAADYPPNDELEKEYQEGEKVTMPTINSTPRPKRKARASPGVISLSDEDEETGSVKSRDKLAALSKLRVRKRQKSQEDVEFPSDDCMEEASSAGISAESDRSAKRSSKGRKKESTVKNPSPRTKKDVSVVISSEDEEVGMDFAPDDLRVMGATCVGTIGIDCLKNVERMRAKSKNLQGGISGKMRKDLTRAIDVIKTLILKAETTGDVHKLRIDNRSLKDEIERFKMEEIHRKREMDEMKSIVGGLKKQIEDLKDQLDFAEEDRRKARESQRLAEWKAKNRSDNEVFSGNVPSNIEEDVNPIGEQERPRENPILEPMEDTATEITKEEASTDIENRNNKEINEEIADINTQIRKLAKKKAEIKKLGITNDKDVNKNKVVSRDIFPPPLPQCTPRIKPKVLSNVQLVLPRSESDTTGVIPRDLTKKLDKKVVSKEIVGLSGLEGPSDSASDWKTARNRGRGRRNRRNFNLNQRRQDLQVTGGNSQLENENLFRTSSLSIGQQRNNRRKAPDRRPPKTVTITGKDKEFSYAAALKKARASISLSDLQIEKTRIRKAANGGLLIEILGPEGSVKAETLAGKLKEILQDKAKIARPIAKGEIRMIGLDDSVTIEKVADAIVQYGKCTLEDTKVGIRPMNNGLFTIWAQCPLSAAVKIANLKKIKLGWTLVRVDLLDPRPVQCFKCWRFEHLKNSCTSEVDYSGLCFKCGGDDHRAKTCDRSPRCKICSIDGKEASHRLGSVYCTVERKPN